MEDATEIGCARVRVIAAPVGFWRPREMTTAGTRGPSARSSASGRGPSSSIANGAGTRPSDASRSSSAGNVGSSTATRSPGRGVLAQYALDRIERRRW